MYIVTRYVVWEVLKYFLAAVVALTLIVTPVMVIKEGLGRGYPAMVMLRIMPFTLPEMLGITIPASMLFSVCSVFGRMTGANEVVALKSLGISPMAIVWPAIVLASFMSLGTVWMYEIAATWCKPKALQIGHRVDRRDCHQHVAEEPLVRMRPIQHHREARRQSAEARRQAAADPADDHH